MHTKMSLSKTPFPPFFIFGRCCNLCENTPILLLARIPVEEITKSLFVTFTRVLILESKFLVDQVYVYKFFCYDNVHHHPHKFAKPFYLY